MNKKCFSCKGEVEEGFMFCENCWTVNPQLENQEETAEAQFPSYLPNSDYSDTDKKSYEMREIHPNGKDATKYRWFICTPKFPEEQYKINDPHCHAWPNDKRGGARISLDPSTHNRPNLKLNEERLRELTKQK